MDLGAEGGRQFWQGRWCGVLWLTLTAAGTLPAFPAPPSPAPEAPTPKPPPPAGELPEALTLDAAIRWALERNPEIAAVRQQRGIAAAAVVIARTYPFNPVWESSVRAAFGPESAAVTNSVPVTERVAIDLEVRGQWKIRREAALAALSRTDWEIAFQELTLAVRVVRAFDTVVYRFRKLKVLEAGIELNREARDLVERLVKKGTLTRADLIFIETEILNARAQLNVGRAALATAWQDLYRALGLTAGTFDLQGGFELPPPLENEGESLLEAALDGRPDLRAHRIAVNEADARVRLEIANRFGNPNVGPAYENNETRTNFVGLQFALPLPVLNTHRGDILQRQAERARAALELTQNEVLVRQDVRAALARLQAARRVVDYYSREVLPNLEKALADIRALFEARAPGADLLRVIEVQRTLLRARDTELDALFELRLALADLAAAIGDPKLAVLPCPNP
jgi:cobalt-zinc-cadmium efflux system outer membrane protein